jgi:hypothetical protein
VCRMLSESLLGDELEENGEGCSFGRDENSISGAESVILDERDGPSTLAA